MSLLNKDSLLGVLKTSKPDTNKVLLLIKIGNDYERNQPDSAIYFYKFAGDLSRKLRYDIGVLKYIANYTAVLNMQDKLDESLQLNLQAVELSQKIHDVRYLGKAYANTAAVYTLMHLHKLSIEYYLKCIAVFEQLHDEEKLAVVYSNLASIYADIDQNEKAIWYGFKCISICRKTKDDYNLEASLNNTANAFTALKRYDTALVLYNQAKQLSKKLNDQYTFSEAVIGLSEIFSKKMLLVQMKESAVMAFNASKLIDHKEGMAKSILLLARYYFELKQYELAKAFAQKDVAMAVKNKLLETEQAGYSLLSDINLAMGNLPAFHLYRNQNDSVMKIMVSQQIIHNTQELEIEYASAKKEATINNLTRIQQLQQLSLKQGKIVSSVLVALLLILILSGLLFYRNYINKRKLLRTESIVAQQRIYELEKEKQLVAVKAVLQGQEQERERLAKDLHDGLGSILSGVKYNFAKTREQLAATPETAHVFIKSMSMLDECISELRRIAHNLMPEAIMKFGLIAAVRDLCENINQNGSLKLTFQYYNLQEGAIPLEISSVIFRMIQELFQNILKHGNAENALIQLVGKEHDLSVTVEDDGEGFSFELLEKKKGIGFTNIKNRVVYLNGILDITSAPGKGTSINIELPNIIL
jgi:two-component system, NarL family, sensor kinase